MQVGQLAVAAEKQARLAAVAREMATRHPDRTPQAVARAGNERPCQPNCRSSGSRSRQESPPAGRPSLSLTGRGHERSPRRARFASYRPSRRGAPAAYPGDRGNPRRCFRGRTGCRARSRPPAAPRARLDGSQIVVGKLVDESPLAQRLLDLLVPERLRVVVPRQIDNTLPLRLSKPLERGEEFPVLGAFDRHRRPVLSNLNLAYLQEIEKSPARINSTGPSLPASSTKRASSSSGDSNPSQPRSPQCANRRQRPPGYRRSVPTCTKPSRNAGSLTTITHFGPQPSSPLTKDTPIESAKNSGLAGTSSFTKGPRVPSSGSG